MPLSISGWRKGKKPVETPQEPVRQEPLAQPGAPAPLKAEEISATTERLKKLRKRLQRNGAVEAYRLAKRSLPHVVSGIEARATAVSKGRGRLLVAGSNPDQLIRGLGEERRRAEENVVKLKTAALEDLQKLREEYSSEAGAICSRAWQEWSAFRRELFDFIARYGDLDIRLGTPMEVLGREVSEFNDQFKLRSMIPNGGAIQPPIRVPRLGRGWSWRDFGKVVNAIKAWLI